MGFPEVILFLVLLYAASKLMYPFVKRKIEKLFKTLSEGDKNDQSK